MESVSEREESIKNKRKTKREEKVIFVLKHVGSLNLFSRQSDVISAYIPAKVTS